VKLAEALALRGDATKRLEQLRTRAQANARFQEGERPAENVEDLLGEADQLLNELGDLIRRINRTNAVTPVDEQLTLADAIARRDVLRLRESLYTGVADAASGLNQVRRTRSELRHLPAVPVSDLRVIADKIAREHRELDIRIQRVNWEADLAD